MYTLYNFRARNTETSLEGALSESRKNVAIVEQKLRKMESRMEQMERPHMMVAEPSRFPPNATPAAERILPPISTSKRPSAVSMSSRRAWGPIDVTAAHGSSTECSARWKAFATFSVPLGFLVHIRNSFAKADHRKIGYLDAAQLGEWAMQQGIQEMTIEKANKMIKQVFLYVNFRFCFCYFTFSFVRSYVIFADQVDLSGAGRVNFWSFLAIQSFLILNMHSKYNLKEWVAFVTQKDVK